MSDKNKTRKHSLERSQKKRMSSPGQPHAPENTDRAEGGRSVESVPGPSGLACIEGEIKKECDCPSSSKRLAESKNEHQVSSNDEYDEIVYFDEDHAVLPVTDDWDTALPVINNVMMLQKIKKNEKEKWLEMNENEFNEYQNVKKEDKNLGASLNADIKENKKEEESAPSPEVNLNVENLNEQNIREKFSKEKVDDDSIQKEVSEKNVNVEKICEAQGQVESDVGFEWQSDFSLFKGQKETYLREPGPTISSTCPYTLFTAIWDEVIMKVIVQETNKYALQMIAPPSKSGRGFLDASRLHYWEETNVDEMYLFFAILIYISLDFRVRLDEYWMTGILEMPGLRSLMRRDRFFLLLKFLHFVNSDKSTHTLTSYEKKIHKVRVIVDHCNEKFTKLYIPKQYICLDESLLLWKGQLSWIQAARSGIKSYELCEGDTGYLLRTLLHAGKTSRGKEVDIHGFENQTAKIVFELIDGYLDVGHVLTMDNFYNQVALTRYLKSRKTDVIGTIGRQKNNVPDVICSLEEHSMPRGQMIARHCGDISVIAWKYTKLITMISTYHTDEFYLEQHVGETIIKPKVVKDYNKYMGGVDLKDQRLSLYLMERKRATKWYLKVFRRLLNTSLQNMYLILKANVARNSVDRCYITHRQFRFALADLLVRHHKHVLPEPTAQPPGPPHRLDKHSSHVLVNTNFYHTRNSKKRLQRRRCARCTAAGRIRLVTKKCERCNVGLCGGQCFYDYHTLQTLG